jgi:hypothetical protein
LLFTVLIVEQLATYKTGLLTRRAEEQRLRGFEQVFQVYRKRYLLYADAMTRPTGSYAIGTTFERTPEQIAFADMAHMYNPSMLRFMPDSIKCYHLYFRAAMELGDLISHNLVYVHSEHYPGLTDVLTQLVANNNRIELQLLYESFREKENQRVGEQRRIDHDTQFLQQLGRGEIQQTPEFIEQHSHTLSDYVRVYNRLMHNIRLLATYQQLVGPALLVR